MKKSVIFLIIILLLGCLSVPVVFAENSTVDKNTDSQIDAEILSNTDYYMNLKNTNAIDKSNDFLCVANENSIFVKDNAAMGFVIDDINKNATDFKIEKILIINNKIAVLTKYMTSTKLYLVDKATKNITEQTGDFSAIYTISKLNDKLAIIGMNNIFTYTFNDNNTLTQDATFKLNLGAINQSGLKFIDNELYFADQNKIYKCKLQDNIFTNDKLIKTLEENVKNSNNFNIVGETIIYLGVSDKIYINDTVCETKNTTFNQIAFDSAKQQVLATTENQVNIYDTNGNQNGYYACKGDDINRLNQPSDIYSDGTNLLISDTENSRIIKYNLKDKTFDQINLENNKPTSAVCLNGKIYYIANNKLFEVNNDIALKDDVKSIAVYSDKLIILTSNAICYLNDSTPIVANISSDFDKIKTANKTNYLYVFSKATGNIKKINLETKTEQKMLVEVSANYDVDFRGALITQQANSIKKWTQKNGELVNPVVYALNNAPQDIISCIDTFNGDYYFVSKSTNLLYKISGTTLEISGTNNIDYAHPTNFNIIKAGQTKKDCEALISPDNPESTRKISQNEKFLILAISKDGNYYYVANEENNEKEYIKKEYLTLFDNINQKNKKMSAIVGNVDVFKYPYSFSEKIKDSTGKELTLSPKTEVSCILKIAKDDIWNWYKINFKQNGENITGYVKANYITEITPTSPPQNIIFMKSKAKKIGENICIYEKADVNSKVLFDDVKDGIDIQLIGEFNENATFSKVYYQGKEGFILNENLQKNGLTPNQIIAISITCTAVVAFIIILILFVQKNKRNKKKVSKIKPEMLE